MKKETGFSVVELSIVLLVIGIIFAAIAKSGSMIKQARLSSARSITIGSQMTAIPGLIAWYETSIRDSFILAEADDGKQLTTWYNREPVGFLTKNSLTATVSPNLTYKIDGINDIPTLNKTATGKLQLANFYQGALSNSTIIVVFKPTVAPDATAKILIDAGAGASTYSIGIKSNAVTFNAGTLVDATGAAGLFAIGNKYILVTTINGSLATLNATAYVNNATTSVGAASFTAGQNSLNGLTVGTDKIGAAGITAEISEVMVFNRVVKIDERKDIMAYLSKKYKIDVAGL